MVKVKGVQIDYELHPGSSSRFNQKMFGRISWRNNKGNLYVYYVPGVLDNVPHCRIYEGRIFIKSEDFIDYDPILSYCSKFDTSTVEKDTDDILLKTGKEKWQFYAKEKNYSVNWK